MALFTANLRDGGASMVLSERGGGARSDGATQATTHSTPLTAGAGRRQRWGGGGRGTGGRGVAALNGVCRAGSVAALDNLGWVPAAVAHKFAIIACLRHEPKCRAKADIAFSLFGTNAKQIGWHKLLLSFGNNFRSLNILAGGMEP